MGNRNDMNIIKFIESFPDENSCREHFKEVREKQGIVCKKCGCTKHYWLKAKWQWQCSECLFRTGLRSGTMMENYKLPIRKWYLAMAFMSFSKKGILCIMTQIVSYRLCPICLCNSVAEIPFLLKLINAMARYHLRIGSL